jgi:predicted transcriptional regulator
MEKATYNTRLDKELIKRFKILAIELGLRQNELLEESIKDVLKKYEQKKPAKKPKS